MSKRSRRRQRSAARRRFPRWRVDGGPVTGPIVTARVLDLSPAGAHIETAGALRVGELYTFTLELAGVSRRLSGRVRWCRLVGTREATTGERTPVYRAGIVWTSRHVAPATGADDRRG